MYPSDFRNRLRAGQVLLSTSLFTREPHVAAAIYGIKPDWVWIDQEHAPWGTESVGLLAIHARQQGVAGVIRVAWNDPALLKKAYDVGAVGVIVPQVDTPDEARAAVRYGRYPPIGERGIAPWFAQPMGLTADDVIRHANQETVLVLQMESVEAYERIDEILAVAHFDVVLVGPMDLSASLGIPGQLTHPRVEKIMLDMAGRVKGTGKALATTWADPEQCRRWIREGYRMMNVGSVLNLGLIATKRHFAAFREEFA
jgi:4-hydroxy-2-oxoheptanedioate aldolase